MKIDFEDAAKLIGKELGLRTKIIRAFGRNNVLAEMELYAPNDLRLCKLTLSKNENGGIDIGGCGYYFNFVKLSEKVLGRYGE